MATIKEGCFWGWGGGREEWKQFRSCLVYTKILLNKTYSLAKKACLQCQNPFQSALIRLKI